MVTPKVKRVEYVIDFKSIILRKLKLAVADGVMIADGEVFYQATDLKVFLEPPAVPA
jgi:3-hydroxyacyl-[acyl-carrier protein] dehydratase/trans-2-decenoyl-[acyl-carrier protein] isomerase